MTINTPTNLRVHEIVERVGKATNIEQRARVLKRFECWALKDLILGAMGPIEFELPDTPPPYEPANEEAPPSNLHIEHKLFGFFVKNSPKLIPVKFKRERKFIEILEKIHPEDAKLVLKMVAKQQIGKGLTRRVIDEAFPDLLPKGK